MILTKKRHFVNNSNNLKMSDQCTAVIKKANTMLGLISKNIDHKVPEIMEIYSICEVTPIIRKRPKLTAKSTKTSDKTFLELIKQRTIKTHRHVSFLQEKK